MTQLLAAFPISEDEFKFTFSFSDSPMDMSVVEGEAKPVNVNEIPEYAAEIHEYLRELEVRDCVAEHQRSSGSFICLLLNAQLLNL